MNFIDIFYLKLKHMQNCTGFNKLFMYGLWVLEAFIFMFMHAYCMD